MPRLLPLLCLLLLSTGLIDGLQRCNKFYDNSPVTTDMCPDTMCYTLTIHHNLGVTHKGGCARRKVCSLYDSQILNTPNLKKYYGIVLPEGVTELRSRRQCCDTRDMCNSIKRLPVE